MLLGKVDEERHCCPAPPRVRAVHARPISSPVPVRAQRPRLGRKRNSAQGGRGPGAAPAAKGARAGCTPPGARSPAAIGRSHTRAVVDGTEETEGGGKGRTLRAGARGRGEGGGGCIRSAWSARASLGGEGGGRVPHVWKTEASKNVHQYYNASLREGAAPSCPLRQHPGGRCKQPCPRGILRMPHRPLICGGNHPISPQAWVHRFGPTEGGEDEGSGPGILEVPAALFDEEPRLDILHRVVVWQRRQWWQGTASAKNRWARTPACRSTNTAARVHPHLNRVRPPPGRRPESQGPQGRGARRGEEAVEAEGDWACARLEHPQPHLEGRRRRARCAAARAHPAASGPTAPQGLGGEIIRSSYRRKCSGGWRCGQRRARGGRPARAA